MTKISRILLLILTLFALLPISSLQAQAPVVYGVFFYSPTCPHCHKVLSEDWPGIERAFGDQLKVLFINVSTPEGSTLMSNAMLALGSQSNGVPTLVIGQDVLIGELDIPDRAPTIIRAGLSAGGIGLPAIPGIEGVYAAAQARQDSGATASQFATLISPGTPAFNIDMANMFAILILFGLVISLLIVARAAWQFINGQKDALRGIVTGEIGLWGLRAGILFAIILSLSLLAGSTSDLPVASLAAIILVLFLVLVYVLARQPLQLEASMRYLPLVALAGLIVAGYLTYVETTLSEAVCGAFGDCNLVQQSQYARIIGIPVGVIGIVGYAAILALWALRQWMHIKWADTALFALSFLGVAFSIYLTALEPFVIGTSCLWCLTSAVVMAILLWMTTPTAWKAPQPQQRRARHQA